MQAIRNKLHSKSKRNEEKRRSMENTAPIAPVTAAPSVPDAVVTSFKESHEDKNGTHVDHYEKTEVLPASSSMDSSIPIPPPMPPADNWKGDTTEYDAYYSDSYASPLPSIPTESVRTVEVLPTEFIEKPVVIHESIREEQVEEIQPIVKVEREKTEIRQITQPLVDKEIRAVIVQERTLDVEVLPTIITEAKGMPEQLDISTREFDATMRQVVEKTPIVQETEKWRVIEEIQPIIYREIVVPHIIRTNRPMREVVVESPIFTEQVLVQRELTTTERERWSMFFNKETVLREVIPTSSVPITTIVEPLEIRVATDFAHGRKEVIEEVVTTTTTTTAAPMVGSARSASFTSGASSLSQPAIVEKTHDVKLGANGETIIRDTMTTSSSSLLPARAM